MSPKKVFPNARKLGIEIHKFGGASLADAAAFRRVVEIVKTRTAPRIVVVSAPAGVTDTLLGLAKRAAAGDGASTAKEVDDLGARYLEILRGAAKRGTKEVAAEIGRSMDELERLLSSLAVLKELTPRTRDFIVSRGERLSARLLAAALDAAGVRARYVDATEVIFTDGPFGGASPNLMLTDLAARKVLRPLCAAGLTPVIPGFIGAAKIDDRDGDHGHDHAHGDDRRALGVATLGRGGTDLTATLLGRALSAKEISPLEGRPGAAHRRPAGRPRRARDPAAACPRGGRAGLLRRQGPAPAGAHPRLRPLDPGVRPAVRRRDRRRHRDLRAPHARSLSGQGALGGGRAGAAHRRRERHAGRAGDRGADLRGAAPRGDQRVAHLAVFVGAVDLLLRSPRGRRAGRASG